MSLKGVFKNQKIIRETQSAKAVHLRVRTYVEEMHGNIKKNRKYLEFNRVPVYGLRYCRVDELFAVVCRTRFENEGGELHSLRYP